MAARELTILLTTYCRYFSNCFRPAVAAESVSPRLAAALEAVVSALGSAAAGSPEVLG